MTSGTVVDGSLITSSRVRAALALRRPGVLELPSALPPALLLPLRSLGSPDMAVCSARRPSVDPSQCAIQIDAHSNERFLASGNKFDDPKAAKDKDSVKKRLMAAR